MDRLPTEVFQYLLTVVSDGIRNGFEPWDVYTLLVRLRLVSHSWMDAIDSHPPLWTLITNRHGEQLSQLAIERSGALPLHIDLWYSSSANPRQYINAVVQLAPRWLSLSIAWEGYKGLYHEALGSLLLTRAPQLKRIRFKGFPDSISNSVPLFDNAAPKLHTAIMDQSFLPNSWKSFLTSDLRRLVLRWMSGVRERDLEGLARVIAASPGLEELELVGWSPVGPINVVPVRRDLTLDRLGKLRIRNFPWQWALSLLAATHIPQTCISDISLDVSEAGPQVDGLFKLFEKELHQAASLAITLDKSLSAENVGLACTTRHAARTEIKFTWSPSDERGEGPSSLVGSLVDEINKEVQNLHLPLSLYVNCEFLKDDSANAAGPFLSSLTVADPLLPSVTRVKLKGWSLSLFLEHSKLHQFTSLSTLEIESVKDESLLNDLAKWIRARSQPAKSEPNAVKLKTVTLPCKKLRPAAMSNLSLLLGDLVDLNWR